jgi:N-acetylmuramoyl-L-alanine amidase
MERYPIRPLVLSAGHNPRAKGAKALGTHEYDLTILVAHRLADLLDDMGIPVVLVDSTLGLSERCQWVLENHGDSIALEVHFNSFNGKAEGTEVFYKAGDRIGFNFGRKFLDGVSKGLNLRSRGMKLATQSARGSLAWTSKLNHGVLWEVCFMDNPNDMDKVNNWDESLKVIASVIRETLIMS